MRAHLPQQQPLPLHRRLRSPSRTSRPPAQPLPLGRREQRNGYPQPPPRLRPAETAMGVEILTPGATTGGTATPADANGGLKAVGPATQHLCRPLKSPQRPLTQSTTSHPNHSPPHRLQTPTARRIRSRSSTRTTSPRASTRRRRGSRRSTRSSLPTQRKTEKGCSHGPHPFFSLNSFLADPDSG